MNDKRKRDANRFLDSAGDWAPMIAGLGGLLALTAILYNIVGLFL